MKINEEVIKTTPNTKMVINRKIYFQRANEKLFRTLMNGMLHSRLLLQFVGSVSTLKRR